jgi:carboxyl-terminal processing protease
VDVEDAENDLAPLINLYADLKQQAKNAPDDQVLVEGAIEGMLETLNDDYARYFPPEAMEAFQAGVRGEFVGIGVFIEDTPDGVTIVSVIPESPAEEAGLEAGWRIVSVDGVDVRNEPSDGVARRVQGEEGTEVTVGFEDEAGQRHERTLTRARIDIPTIDTEVEDGIGTIRMIQFTNATGEQFAKAVEELIEQEGVEGLLLDLRGNGGGLLNEGPVVRVVEADGRERGLESSNGGYTEIPAVVLVNEGSASATEILAGALQTRGRAELVGTATFGKGTVQTISTFTDGSGAKFTTAEYFLPDGTSVEGAGLTPDESVADREQQRAVARALLEQKVAERAGSR